MYKGKWKGDEPTQAGPQHWIGAPRPSCTHPAPYPPPPTYATYSTRTHPTHLAYCSLPKVPNPSYSAAHCFPSPPSQHI